MPGREHQKIPSFLQIKKITMSRNDSKEKLLIGKEYPKPGEEKIANQIVELLKAQMLRLSKNKKMQRQIHPKMNGCVKAEFIIETNLPSELKVGLFKDETSFPAWIRMSNGSTKPCTRLQKRCAGICDQNHECAR